MDKAKLKVQFTDVWSQFDITDNIFINSIRERFEVESVDDSPDLLIYSVFGENHKQVNAKTKLLFSPENSFPDFSACDYAISTVRINLPGRTLYVPLALDELAEPLIPLHSIDENLFHRSFCCFIYSQDNVGQGAITRTSFAQRLMQYKYVECPGKVLHNKDIPELSGRFEKDWRKSKIKYISRFKFVIAFENSDNIGYITEKLTHAYVANTVPIYWGSTADVSPFPKESMICAADYPTLDALIEKIKEVDNDPEQYMKILRANPLYNPNFVEQSELLIQKRKLFIQEVAESALKLKPEFQSRLSASMWEANLRSAERNLFCHIMPKAFCINVSNDYFDPKQPIERAIDLKGIDKVEAYMSGLTAISEKSLSALKAVTAQTIQANTVIDKISSSLEQAYEGQLASLKNKVETEMLINSVPHIIRRLRRQVILLSIKSFFASKAKRTIIKEQLINLKQRLRQCRAAYKDLSNISFS